MKTNKILLTIFFSLILMLVFNLDIYAANASIKLDKSTVEVGKPVKITVSGSGVQWKLKLKVDGEELKSSSELENYESNKNISFSVSYTPKTAGTKNVTLEGSVTEFSDGTTVKSFSPKTITVTEKKTDNGGSTGNQNANGGSNNNSSGNNSTTNNNLGSSSGTTSTKKSTNAYLSTLGVRLSNADATELGVGTDEYDFKGFSKSSLTYKVTVPYEVESLKVSYKAAHSGATIKVTGNTGFDVGSSNKITIKVTAEDGKTTKTYTIKVTRLAEEEEKPGNIIDDDKIEELFLTSLSIKGVEISPEFSKDVYAYTATLSKNLTEVEVNAVANNESASIEVSGNTDLIVGENTINIVVKQEESTLQTVYQITLTKEAALVTTDGQEVNFMGSLIDNIKNYLVIAVIVVVLIIAAVIILIILLRKENKKLKSEETEEEYNVYENDENEFEDNKDEEKVKEPVVEEVTNETETKNEGRRTRRREKGRHSK